jgi:RimJ/RimL family protein N-acetyltransferase
VHVPCAINASVSINLSRDQPSGQRSIGMTDSEELSTPRLILRRPVESDAAATIAIVGDFEVARRLGRVPHPYHRSDFDQFLEHVVPNEPTWAIILRQTNELIGMTGLAPQRKQSSAELGYYLGHPFWGAGFATEAGQAVVRFGFERLGCTKLASRCHADNPASGKVLAKLGFKTVGSSNHHCLAEGRDKPSIEMELAASRLIL